MTVALRPPDLVNLAGQDTGREHISHTALGVFLACQQRYGWQYARRLAPAVTAAPLQVGRAFALAREHLDPAAGEQAILEDAASQAEQAAASPWVTAPDPGTVRVRCATG
jgi:hypothetical protein